MHDKSTRDKCVDNMLWKVLLFGHWEEDDG